VGLTASCVYDPQQCMFRICVKFLDLTQEAGQRLSTLSQGAKLLCPYCANF
jgi:hypothetical protein